MALCTYIECFFLLCEVEVKVTQSCPTLCDPMDCPWNSPGQNTGVGSLFLLQRIFPTQDRTQVLCIAGWFFNNWATREAQKAGFCSVNLERNVHVQTLLVLGVYDSEMVTLILTSSFWQLCVNMLHSIGARHYIRSVCVHAQLIWFFATPRNMARQVPLSMGFPKQEYWSGLPFPSPGDLPDPETEPTSPELQADSSPWSHQGSPCKGWGIHK